MVLFAERFCRVILMQNDFSKGPVWKNIISQAVPLTVAQIVHLLYNVVDRIYIGHMGEEGSMALTGVGLTFPVLTLIMAFAALFGMGGVPLFSIERGARYSDRPRLYLYAPRPLCHRRERRVL